MIADFLTKDEKIEVSAKPDFTATFLPIPLLGVMILLVNIYLFTTMGGSQLMFKFFLLILSVSIFGFLFAVAGLYLRYIYTFYFVTNKRIIYESGIISKDHRDCRLERIQNIYVGVGFIDRVLDIGDIYFSTAGEMGVEVIFRRCRNPLELKKRINEVIDRDVLRSNLRQSGV
ncbi:MAG: PH domain-containing protein [Candidatus Altiarchaeales archaeon]|nr:PH domain-containing protein [Candidatus Altiarchaeales archaeon]